MNQLSHFFQSNQFILAGLWVSMIGALVFSLKSLPSRLWERLRDRLIFSATIFNNDPLYDDFENWFFSHYKDKYRHVEAVTTDSRNYTHPISVEIPRVVRFKQINGLFLIRYKGVVILVFKGREKLEKATEIRNAFVDQYKLQCFYKKNVIKSLLEECVEYNVNRDRGKLRVYSHSEWGEWVLTGVIEPKSINSIILPKSIKQTITDDIMAFKSNKSWYKERSIFYKRGHLYYGEPGNGKTSLSLAIASFMNRDLYYLDLNQISDNSALKRLFASISNTAVLSIEELDGAFKLREPVKKDCKISFSTFLNCIDGAFYKEGVFTIMTTNYIDHVDPAILRPGRIDLKVEIKNPTIYEVNEYLKNFYGKDAVMLHTYNHTNYSMSDIQECCMSHRNDPMGCVVKEFGYVEPEVIVFES